VDASLRRQLLDIIDELSADADVSTSVRISGAVDTLVEEELAEHAAAVLREAFGNAVRHARAHSIVVIVELSKNLTIEVVDDGVGLPPGAAASGLRAVEDRAVQCGGSLVVGPSPAGGTRLTWRVPLPVA
jgi:signal transduction histidine kinase